MRIGAFIRRGWCVIWASPYSVLGLLAASAAIGTGGTARYRDGALGVCGGILTRGLRLLPGPAGAWAITLGHVVLATDERTLEWTHAHEMVHVRQYERWGPFMGPAYLGCSLALWCQGKDAYRDNPFEREAFDAAPL